MTFEQGLALVIVAIITVIGTIYGARKSARSDRARIDQTMVTVMGTERARVADELEKVKQRAVEQDEQMERVRAALRAIQEEYSEAKIVHRQALAELTDSIRERDITIREAQARTTELEAILAATRVELGQARTELQNALQLIHQQAQALQEQRERELTVRRELTKRGEDDDDNRRREIGGNQGRSR